MAVVLVEGGRDMPVSIAGSGTYATPAKSVAGKDILDSVARVVLLASGFFAMCWANPMAVLTMFL